jgi:hypothetical protein
MPAAFIYAGEEWFVTSTHHFDSLRGTWLVEMHTGRLANRCGVILRLP